MIVFLLYSIVTVTKFAAITRFSQKPVQFPFFRSDSKEVSNSQCLVRSANTTDKNEIYTIYSSCTEVLKNICRTG